MRLWQHNKLYRRHHAPQHVVGFWGEPSLRGGFTLTELIVAVGVLGLLMALAGTVFHVTLKSTGEAKAIMAVNQRLQELEDNLRADLGGIDPSGSILVIAPAHVHSYWTKADAEGDTDKLPGNGYPHEVDPDRTVFDPDTGLAWIDSSTGLPVREYPRADVLTFVTNRSGRSFVDPKITGQLQMVTYGHAIIGEAKIDSSVDSGMAWVEQFGEDEEEERHERFYNATVPYQGDPIDLSINSFPMPASEWHWPVGRSCWWITIRMLPCRC